MSTSHRTPPEKSPFREMTVAQVREPKGLDYLEIAFLESARFYKLFRNNSAFNEILRLLRGSVSTGRSLQVSFTILHGDIIDRVQPADPSPAPSVPRRHG